MIDRDDDESPRRRSVAKQKGRKNQKFKNNIKQIDINNLDTDDENDNPFDEFEGFHKFFEPGN